MEEIYESQFGNWYYQSHSFGDFGNIIVMGKHQQQFILHILNYNAGHILSNLINWILY